MLGLRDNLQKLRGLFPDLRLARFESGSHMQRNKRKDTWWFPECTTFQEYEDVIGIGWIHIKMTEKSEQNENIRMSRESHWRGDAESPS
ncbi:hypothetical protein B9Z55_001455 [Caenorhabditis nigoni]|uniref:Uncharacterized protein n=1 Tax=Caenorhabditis nigoni TaxID=1611254 RepID=A0A2G5VFS6_9PELO|nr:hypothetical protein B9Z55_001455 [Caenorhabditis nigoni]